MDALAAGVIALMLARIAWGFGRPAVAELVDAVPDPALVRAVTAALAAVSRVREVHALRLRQSWGAVQADVHLGLDPALNLLHALALGAAIGMERQWRQRLAGLRTNTLVALGSASFVIFAATFPDEIGPTRVAARIVPGIGFPGAGIIFREGFKVRGLNTAATLWCAAAVGMLAGAGEHALASAVAGCVTVSTVSARRFIGICTGIDH